MGKPGKRRRNGKRRAWTSRFSRTFKQQLVDILIARDGHMCQICHKPMMFDFRYRHHEAYRTFDHITSPNDGGPISGISNLQLAHQACNNRRQNGHPNGS